jgi:hypothetical protein
MPGGLIQLVGVGAQNELVNGNPSMTHFRAVYRRHTNFAMDQIRMPFTASNLEFPATGTRTISCRVDRYAQLLHDCYLVLTLPDIWSPMKYIGQSARPAGYDPRTDSIGYEFQWIQNIGYNLIDYVDITMNGQVIQRLRGEWLKLYSYMTHDANKRAIVDQMVGNVPELYDPAHAYDRNGQYPNAITPTALPSASPQTKVPEPSIRSRQLVIPLHFWFCENPGLALPLVSLQNSEVYINVSLRNVNDLYTVVDVNPASTTYGQRIKPTGDSTYNGLNLFLSPPLSTGLPSNPTLTTWFPDPYVEGNFIYLTEAEMNQLARADQTFLIKTVRYVSKEGQFGGNTDLEIPMFNLVTRIVFASQRSDRILVNDWDNYTNWNNPNRAPWSVINSDVITGLYSSGQQQVSSVFPRSSLIDGVILFDGKERIQPKPLPFFSLLQMYRYITGQIPDLPGVFMYSFALDHSSYQPSGAANGSMFNKIILRLTLQQPLPESTAPGTSNTTQVCVLTSTLFSPNPTVIPAANLNLTDAAGRPLYPPGTVTTVVQSNDNIIFTFTYTVGVYVESINFLRIVSGLGNLVFAS